MEQYGQFLCCLLILELVTALTGSTCCSPRHICKHSVQSNKLWCDMHQITLYFFFFFFKQIGIFFSGLRYYTFQLKSLGYRAILFTPCFMLWRVCSTYLTIISLACNLQGSRAERVARETQSLAPNIAVLQPNLEFHPSARFVFLLYGTQ